MGIYCEGCDELLDTEEIAINADNHADYDTYEEVITAATCTDPGQMGIYCEGCDELLDTEEIAINADNHADYDTYEEVITAATCTDPGEMGIYCEGCDELLDTEEIPPNGQHEWDDGEYTDPTCTEDGFTTFTCDVCGNTEIEIDEGSALGHLLGEWEVTTPANCCQEGEETAYCERDGCDETDTKTIDRLVHLAVESYSITRRVEISGQGNSSRIGLHVDLTFTLSDSSTHTRTLYSGQLQGGTSNGLYPQTPLTFAEVFGCTEVSIVVNFAVRVQGNTRTIENVVVDDSAVTACDSRDFHVIDSEGDTVAPTCLADGYTLYTCSRCAREFKDVDLGSALGHAWNEGEETTIQTCVTPGVMTYTCTRTDCGITRDETIGIDPDNHVGYEFVEPVVPTCMAAGYDI